MAKNKIDGAEYIELDEDIDGNPFLEGAKPQVIKEIWEAGTRHVANKVEHKLLTDALKADKEELKVLYGKYPAAFEPLETDPDKKFVYAVAGLTVEIDREETLNVKTAKDSPPPISVAQQNVDEVSALREKKAADTDEF